MKLAFQKNHFLTLLRDTGAASAPRKVKLFVNKLNLGFSEAEDQAATQELTLKAADVKVAGDPASSATKVLTAKFAKVSSLTIFVADNQSEEETTSISAIYLFGASQSGSAPSNVKTINSPLEYNQYIKNSPGKIVIAYFHASWCSHCRTTGPLIQKLSVAANDAVFLSIDVDKLKATLPEAQEIQGVPHFKIYKEGEKIHEQSGVPDILQNMLQKFEYDVHDSTPGPARDNSGL